MLKNIQEISSEDVEFEDKATSLAKTFLARLKAEDVDFLRTNLQGGMNDLVIDLWKSTMGEADGPSWFQLMLLLLRNRQDEELATPEELDSVEMTPEQKHAIYMRAFAGNLRTEGLRSPRYYQDKSQCLSFDNVSPAEMGYLKARKLKRGYVDPEELIGRLCELKPSR